MVKLDSICQGREDGKSWIQFARGGRMVKVGLNVPREGGSGKSWIKFVRGGGMVKVELKLPGEGRW